MKKTFPCGHKGKGQFCHRCHQKELAQAKKDAIRSKRVLRFDEAEKKAGLDLSKVPLKVAEHAAQVIQEIRSGKMPHKSKRLSDNKSLISVPLRLQYRLLVKDTGDAFQPMSVMTHEEYNKTI